MIVFFTFFVIFDDCDEVKKKDSEITFDDCKFVFNELKKNRQRSKIISINEKSFSRFNAETFAIRKINFEKL